ncbi:MAG: hypothetical protein HEQ31_07500 [Dolichospermum sp. OL03]|jgi:hypothetical protein|nr:hypothetical protein [Dolichospermum sp. OL01]MCO5796633.1 hypothetical protein [Dolichospermum sp. OL03]
MFDRMSFDITQKISITDLVMFTPQISFNIRSRHSSIIISIEKSEQVLKIGNFFISASLSL